MKNLFLLSTLLLFSTIINAQTWSIQHTVLNEEFHHINFFDGNTGWAFRKGNCIKTTDGGTTWTPQNMGAGAADFRILDSYIFDANNMVAVGRHESLEAVIIKTTDGGATWTAQTNFTERLFAVAFRNASEGWAVGDKGIGYHTTDGGTTWTLASFSNDDLSGIAFADANTGVAVGEMGIIYRTTDGGTTWNQVTSGITDDFTKVRFSDASHGWAVGLNGVIVATTDGGATWTSQNSGTIYNLNDAAFVNNLQGWAGGVLGTVTGTIDGGTTWTAASAGIPNEILSIKMVSAEKGWATDAMGNIWHFDGTVNTSPIFNTIDLKVFPNPMIDETTIELDDKKIDKLLIYNTIGDIIIGKTVNNHKAILNKTDLSTGLYFIVIITEDNQRITRKLQVF